MFLVSPSRKAGFRAVEGEDLRCIFRRQADATVFPIRVDAGCALSFACLRSGKCCCDSVGGLPSGSKVCLLIADVAGGYSCGDSAQCRSAACFGGNCCRGDVGAACTSCDGVVGDCRECNPTVAFLAGGSCKAKVGAGTACDAPDWCQSSTCLGNRCCSADTTIYCTACDGTGQCLRCTPHRELVAIPATSSYTSSVTLRCLLSVGEPCNNSDPLCASGACTAEGGRCCGTRFCGRCPSDGTCLTCLPAYYLSVMPSRVCVAKRIDGDECVAEVGHRSCLSDHCAPFNHRCCSLPRSGSNCTECSVTGSCTACRVGFYVAGPLTGHEGPATCRAQQPPGSACLLDRQCRAPSRPNIYRGPYASVAFCKSGICCAGDTPLNCGTCAPRTGQCVACERAYDFDEGPRQPLRDCRLRPGFACDDDMSCLTRCATRVCCNDAATADVLCVACAQGAGRCVKCQPGHFVNGTGSCESLRAAGVQCAAVASTLSVAAMPQTAGDSSLATGDETCADGLCRGACCAALTPRMCLLCAAATATTEDGGITMAPPTQPSSGKCVACPSTHILVSPSVSGAAAGCAALPGQPCELDGDCASGRCPTRNAADPRTRYCCSSSSSVGAAAPRRCYGCDSLGQCIDWAVDEGGGTGGGGAATWTIVGIAVACLLCFGVAVAMMLRVSRQGRRRDKAAYGATARSPSSSRRLLDLPSEVGGVKELEGEPRPSHTQSNPLDDAAIL